MARNRLLNPEHLNEKRFCDLSGLAFGVLPWLPCFADREGRMIDDAFRIRLQIRPTVDLDMDGILAELADKGVLRRYEVEGRRYIQLLDFASDQRPHPNETKSVIPPEPTPCDCSPRVDHGEPKATHGTPGGGHGDALTAGFRSGSGSGSDPDPPIPPQGGQAVLSIVGKAAEPPRAKKPARAVASADFERFWAAYPQHRHVAKAEAIKAWPGDEHAPAIMEALAWQTTSVDWTRDGGSYVPHPSRYLSKRRWTDERPRAAEVGGRY